MDEKQTAEPERLVVRVRRPGLLLFLIYVDFSLSEVIDTSIFKFKEKVECKLINILNYFLTAQLHFLK